MSDTKHDRHLGAVYGASGLKDVKNLYDSWAETYDAEMAAAGYRHPSICLALLARYLPRGAGPLLDAGVGTGLIGEWLGIMGYGHVEGLDISPGMLAVAAKKNVYEALHQLALGSELPFADGAFAGIVSTGVFTTGHVGTEEYIDRANEAVAAREAAKAGVSPEVLHADPDTGIMVTRFIDGAETMTPQSFASRRGAPARAGKAFRKLHTSGAQFPFDFQLFEMIDDYLGILGGKDVELPDGYHDVVAEAETVRSALDAHPAQLAPCHCDPLCENFLDTGEIMWIVDWEYSGMNDPMWDLGDLSVEGEFNDDQDAEMLRAYFDREPTPAEHGRVVIHKAMCDLLWTLWGLIQLANDNPVDDFRAYADGRFARCKKLMADPVFAGHVEAVRKD